MHANNGISNRSSADNAELNIAAPWPMPEWLPDETFFSLASRYHAISGHRLPAHTNLALFGRLRSGSQHDFPTHLNQFAQRTEERLGSAEEIATTHTILPFYFPAKSRDEATAALEALTDPPSGMLKFRLGILTSRFRANHPLKACPVCMETDFSRHGVAYWHRTHQFPGVWVCRRHSVLLHEANLKSTGVQRFGWLLPATSNLRPIVADSSSAMIADLTNLAFLVERWCQLLPGTVNATVLGVTYRSALATQIRTIGRSGIAREYCQALSQLRAVPELAALPATSEAALHQINRWVFAPQGNTHPLRHLSFIFWLFRDWQTFWAAYNRQPTADADEQVSDATVASPTTDLRRESLMALIRAGASATAAAQAVGVDTGTAIAWAATEGIPTHRRPKTLKDDKYIGLIADLKVGTSKAEAAARHSVSLQSVTRLLRSEVGLHRVWHASRLSRARTQARSTWAQALQIFTTEGIAVARRHAPAAYAWLYRNDRSWLVATCADIKPAPSHRAAQRLDWDSRDDSLASQVRQAAARLAEEGQVARLKLWQIYQLVPELKAKLGALDRLPLTRKVILEVTTPRKGRTTPGSLL